MALEVLNQEESGGGAAPFTLDASVYGMTPLQKAAYYNTLIDQGYTDQAIRTAAGQQTDADWITLQGLATGLRPQAPTPTPAPAPIGALSEVVSKVATPVREPALEPTREPAVQKPVEPPAVEKPVDKPIVEWNAPVSIGFGLFRTPGGTIINEQGYPVSQAEADRIMGVGAPAPSPAPAPAPATGALAQASTAEPTPEGVAYDADLGYWTSADIEQRLDKFRSKYPNAQITPILKTTQAREGDTIYLNAIDFVKIDIPSDIPGLRTGINLDVNGNEISRYNYKPKTSAQQIGEVFSVVAPALGPVGLGINAALQASQGNYLGALASAAGAGAGFAGGFDLGTGTMTTPGGTFGGISQSTFSNIAAGANTANALKSGNWAGALSSIAGSGLGAEALGTQIGDTGFTLGDAAKGASALMAIQSGQYGQALTSLGQLAGSRDAVVAGRAATLLQAIQSGNAAAISNAAQQLATTVGDPGRINRLPSTTPGTTVGTGANIDASGLSNVDNLGVSTYVNAINTLGASPDEALAAANAASGQSQGVVSEVGGEGAATTPGWGRSGNLVQGFSNATIGTTNQARAAEILKEAYGNALNWVDQATINRAASYIYANREDLLLRDIRAGTINGIGAYGIKTPQDITSVSKDYIVEGDARIAGPSEVTNSDVGYDANGVPIAVVRTAGTTTGKRMTEAERDQYDFNQGLQVARTQINPQTGEPYSINPLTGQEFTFDQYQDSATARNVIRGFAAPVMKGAGELTQLAGYATGNETLTQAGANLEAQGRSITTQIVREGTENLISDIQNADGMWNKGKAIVNAFIERPLQTAAAVADLTGTELTQELLPFGSALAAGKGVSAALRAKFGDVISARAGTVAGVTANATSDAVEAGLQSAQQVYNDLRSQGFGHDRAADIAFKAGVLSGVIETAASVVGEGPMVAGLVRGVPGSVARTTAREGISEFPAGYTQAAIGDIATNRLGTFDPNAAQTGGYLETLAGGPTSGVIQAGGNVFTQTGAVAGTGETPTSTPGGTSVAATGAGATSTLTGTPGATTTVAGGDISTTGLGTTGLTGLGTTTLPGVNTNLGTTATTATTGAGTGGLDTQTIVNDYVNVVLNGGNATSAASNSVTNAINAATTAGSNVSQAVTNSVGSLVTSAVNSGGDANTAVTSAVNGAVTSAVNAGTDATTAVSSAVNGAVTSAVNAGTNASTAVTSAVNGAVTSAVNSGVDVNTAVNSAVNGAVTSAVNSGVDVNTAVNSAVNGAVTSAVNSGVDVNTAVNSAVNGAVTSSVNSGVDTNTAVNTAVNSAVTAAVNAGVDTNTAITAAVNAAVNAGVDTNVAVNTAVNAAVNVGVDANVATTIATKVDVPTTTGGTDTTRILPPLPPTSTVPGTLTPVPPVTPVTSTTATTPTTPKTPTTPTTRTPTTYTPGVIAAEPVYPYNPTSPRETWTGGMFRNIPAAPNLAALAALFNLMPQQQESEAISALQRASGVTPSEPGYFSYGTEPSPSEVIGSYRRGGNVQDPGANDKMLSSPLMAAAGGDVPHKGSHYVQGAGGGQDDLIPAKLADGEYVFDAEIVAALGDGSNKEGAKKLDAMREAIRKHKRSGSTKTIPPAAKSPLQYLKEANK